MILYHGTSKENKEKILKEGFIIGYGEYGNCLSLAKSKELAYDYGDEIIECFVDDEYITTINWDDTMDRLEVEYNAIKKKQKAVCIVYPNIKSNVDCTEVCIYDLSVVEINS